MRLHIAVRRPVLCALALGAAACASAVPVESRGEKLDLTPILLDKAPSPTQWIPQALLIHAQAVGPIRRGFLPGSADVLRDLAAWDAAGSAERTRRAEVLGAFVPGFAFARLERFACCRESHEMAVFAHGATGLEFVLVPAGTLEAPLADATGDDASARFVVASPFLLARTEVTRRAWAQTIGDERGARGADGGLPQSDVSFRAALAFCRRYELDLPSRSQWEVACRAGTATAFCCGDDPVRLGDYAWFEGNSGGAPHAVATRRPNAFGLFDMHGNVREWTLDFMARGQAADGPAWQCRMSLSRMRAADLVGVRPALTVPAKRPWRVVPGPEIVRAFARGVQRWRCARGADGSLAWTFAGPRAELFDEAGCPIGSHARGEAGPTWTIGGDSVVGTRIAELPSPNAGSIPELELEAEAHGAGGLFADVETIERLDPVGGAAPPVTSSVKEGDEAEVPYTAVYVFHSSGR